MLELRTALIKKKNYFISSVSALFNKSKCSNLLRRFKHTIIAYVGNKKLNMEYSTCETPNIRLWTFFY